MVVEHETYAQAERSLAEGRTAEARLLLEELRAQGTLMWEVYNDLATIHARDGDYAAAAGLLAQAATLEFGSTHSQRNLIRIHALTGEIGDALAVLAQLARLEPADDSLAVVALELLATSDARPGDLGWLSPRLSRQSAALLAAGAARQWHWSRLALPAAGQARCCPICGGAGGDFSPLPASHAEKARRSGFTHFGTAETINLAQYRCTGCEATDRERLMALFIREMLADLPCDAMPRMLHFAPEKALSAWLGRLGRFERTTADIAMPGVDRRMDIADMSAFADRSFDCFVCSHVLEHVDDDRKAMAELHRVLKDSGWGILMAPVRTHLPHTLEDPSATTAAERARLFGQDDHVRLYARHDYIARMRGAGFVVSELGMEHFGRRLFQAAAITDTSVLYVVTKLAAARTPTP